MPPHASSLRAGFYPGYYLSFATAPLATSVEKELTARVKPRVAALGTAAAAAYDAVGRVIVSLTMNYTIMPFVVSDGRGCSRRSGGSAANQFRWLVAEAGSRIHNSIAVSPALTKPAFCFVASSSSAPLQALSFDAGMHAWGLFYYAGHAILIALLLLLPLIPRVKAPHHSHHPAGHPAHVVAKAGKAE
jgi:hypothetical protein